MSKRKFFRSKVIVEILSEEPLNPAMSLSDIQYYTDEGDGCGRTQDMEVEELNAQEAVSALKEFGSEPAFFSLNDAGEDLEGGF